MSRRSVWGRRGLVCAVSALFCVFVLTFSGRADSVRLVGNSTVKAPGGQFSGQILSETATELRIKTATGEHTVPVDQIDFVTYDGAPPSYTLAESRLNAGLMSEAAELFEKSVGEAKGKPLLERAAQFGRAQALADLALADTSKTAEALAALEPLRKPGGNVRQLGPALLLAIQLHLAAGEAEKAEAALDELTSRVPWATDRAAVLRAKILLKKGNPDAALSALDALIAAAPAGSAQAREALLTKAEGLAAARRFDEAEAAAREVIEKSPPEDEMIQAVAYNTLGDCLRAAGKPKDALRAYLRTDILYSGAKDEHARALARIVELWSELKQDARAAEMLEKLKTQYPQSRHLRVKSGSSN